MKGIIYKATNLYNGLSYIGQTRATLEKRRSQHLKDAVTDSVNHFHLALMQYGDSGFKWEILDEFSGSKEEVIHALNVAEEYHILRLKTRLSEYGYNATQGGYSSDKFDDAIRKRALANYGGKGVLQYDLEGNFIQEYESISEVCRKFGTNKYKGCYFLGRKWKGYQWREKINEYFPRKISPWQNVVKKTFTPLVVYTIDGVLYRRYECAKACWSDLGFSCRIRDSFDDADIRIPGKGVLVFRDNGYAPERISVNVIKPKEKREKTDCRVAVVQYDREGNYVAEFLSVSDASRSTGLCTSKIHESCKRPLPYPVGPLTRNIWRKKEGDVTPKIEIEKIVRGSGKVISPKRKYEMTMEHRVLQYSKDGILIKVWGNMYQASLQTGESHTLIRKQCMNLPTKKKTASIWKHYTPDYAQTIEVA